MNAWMNEFYSLTAKDQRHKRGGNSGKKLAIFINGVAAKELIEFCRAEKTFIDSALKW